MFAAVLMAVPPGVFEEAANTGVDFRHAHSPTRNKYLPETMGGGVALLDFDNDGDLDILILNLNEPPSLLRNDLTGDHRWIKVKLIGTKSNRSAIGTRVVASYGGKRQLQEVISQSSYLSCNDRRLHFGLGKAENADLEVQWPSGTKQTFTKLEANQLYVIREGAAKVELGEWPRQNKKQIGHE